MRAFASCLLAAVLSACGGRAIVATELVRGEERPRPPDSVEVYRNGPPPRPFVARYVLDLALPESASGEAVPRAREVGAKLGCDAVIVYTAEHPAMKTPPPDDDQVLAVGMEGVVAWRALGVTVPNRRTLFVQGPRTTITIDAPFALCLAFTSAEGSAARCERDPNPFGPPWPAEGASIPDRAGRPSSLRLTQAEGDDIRCVLLEHISASTTRATVSEPFRSTRGTWDVRAPWLSSDGPRIGEYWIQRGESDAEVVLMRPLGVAPASRYSIGVTMTRRAGGWRVVGFGGVIDHAARGDARTGSLSR